MDLQEELEHPTPRGVLWRWLERKSGARYASEEFPFIFLFLSLHQVLKAQSISDGDSSWRHDCNHSGNPQLGSQHLSSVGGVAAVATPNIDFLSSPSALDKQPFATATEASVCEASSGLTRQHPSQSICRLGRGELGLGTRNAACGGQREGERCQGWQRLSQVGCPVCQTEGSKGPGGLVIQREKARISRAMIRNTLLVDTTGAAACAFPAVFFSGSLFLFRCYYELQLVTRIEVISRARLH